VLKDLVNSVRHLFMQVDSNSYNLKLGVKNSLVILILIRYSKIISLKIFWISLQFFQHLMRGENNDAIDNSCNNFNTLNEPHNLWMDTG
jgi:hypothetical protein